MKTNKHKKLIIDFITIFYSDKSKDEQIKDLIFSIKEFSGIESIAIRLKDGNDYPYYVSIGFSKSFIKLENYLCSYSKEGNLIRDKDDKVVLECMCGAVINAQTNANLSFFSQGGSFCTNCTTKLISDGLPLEWERKVRKQCNREGYESVMCVPLRAHNEIIGLLQLNDSRKNIFTPELIEFYEGIGTAVGVVLKNKETENLLIKERKLSQNYIDIANIIILSLKVDGTVGFVNKKTCEILGYSKEEIVGKNWIENFVPEDIRDSLYSIFIRSISTDDVDRKEIVIYENPVITSSGEIKDIRWHNSIIEDIHGNIIGTLSSGEDITNDKKDKEEKIKITQELQRSNAELEDFAYVASHDLQEPLRVISSYCQLLEDRYSKNIDKNGQKYIRYSIEATYRMKNLIKDLLDFSQIGRKNQSFEEIDLNFLVRDVFKDFNLLVKETNARIIIEDVLEPIYGIKVRIRQLFHNLISNALKFRSDKQPIIRIGCYPDINSFLFFIKDNGRGIDTKYSDRIFGLFKRLYSTDEYPGTGIGLALCKRIVETHGGRIWVESTVDEGSIFYLTIPRHIFLDDEFNK